MSALAAASFPAMSAKVPTFFSHSYRPEDREINVHFWKLFWDAGFAFTVDPKSNRLSIPHLEYTLRHSACFIGVVTRRQDQDRYLTSPYLVFEYGLAVQAKKPRVVFVEHGVSGRYFEPTHSIAFHRDANAGARYDTERARTAIHSLHQMSAPYLHDGIRQVGSVGLFLPENAAYAGARPMIRRLLEAAGHTVVDIPYGNGHTRTPLELILEVDRHDYLVIDIGVGRMPAWLHPMLQGRFVPMIRLLHHEPGRPPGPLPETLRGDVIELVADGYEFAIPWSGVDSLVPQLERELQKLQGERREFSSIDEGLGYFNSVGRSVDATVFVSNARTENDFAQHLSRLFDINNIRFFHYFFRNTIELGTRWMDGLRERLEGSQLFIPLITRAYWESEICRREWEIAEELHARGRLRIYPYLLDDLPPGAGPEMTHQGRRLVGHPLAQQLRMVVRDIDSYLTPQPEGEC